MAASRASLERYAVALSVSMLAAFPAAYVGLRDGVGRMFDFVRGDAHLYITIARRSLQTPFFTYDGEHATSGFHPLWQWLLTTAYRFTDSPSAQLQIAFWLSLSLTALGAGLMSFAIQRITRSPLLGLLPVPGTYFMLVGIGFRNHSIWENVDGMESGLSVFLLGVMVLLLSFDAGLRDNTFVAWLQAPRVLPAIGLMLPLVVLARLDDVFLVGALGLLVATARIPVRQTVRPVLWIGLPTFLSLLSFVIYNQLKVGAPMPLSGATKAGFSLTQNGLVAASAFFAPTVDLKNAVAHKASDGARILSCEFRALQMLVPPLLGAGYALYVRRYKESQALYVLCIAFVLHFFLKGAYNFINVNAWHQGPWYYAFNINALSFLCALMLKDPVATLRRTHPGALRAFTAAYVALALLWTSQQTQRVMFGAGLSTEAAYFERRAEVEAALRKKQVAGLVNFDDGITTLALQIPAIHGWAFAADKQTYDAIRERRLLAAAYARGHDVITGHGYFASKRSLPTSEQIAAFLVSGPLPEQVSAEVSQFDYEEVYFNPALELGFYRFRPKQQMRNAAQGVAPL